MAREASITADAVHDNENSQLEQKLIQPPQAQNTIHSQAVFCSSSREKKGHEESIKVTERGL